MKFVSVFVYLFSFVIPILTYAGDAEISQLRNYDSYLGTMVCSRYRLRPSPMSVKFTQRDNWLIVSFQGPLVRSYNDNENGEISFHIYKDDILKVTSSTDDNVRIETTRQWGKKEISRTTFEFKQSLNKTPLGQPYYPEPIRHLKVVETDQNNKVQSYFDCTPFELNDPPSKTYDIAARRELFCGMDGDITSRIVDCGTVREISKGNRWTLVSRAYSGREVWLDNQTNLLWSDVIGYSPYNKRACENSNLKADNSAKGYLYSVKWELPSADQYKEALKHESPHFNREKGYYFYSEYWTSTRAGFSFGDPISYDSASREFSSSYSKKDDANVLCVSTWK